MIAKYWKTIFSLFLLCLTGYAFAADDVLILGKSVYSPHPITRMNFRSQIFSKDAQGCADEVIVLRFSSGTVDFFVANGNNTKISTGKRTTIKIGQNECEIELNIKPNDINR